MPFRSVLTHIHRLQVPENPFTETEASTLTVAFGRRLISMRQYNCIVQKDNATIVRATALMQSALVSSRAASYEMGNLMKKAIRMDYYFGDDIEISPDIIAAVERRNNITGVGGGDIAGIEDPPNIGAAREPTEDSIPETIEMVREAVIDITTGPQGRRVTVTPTNDIIGRHNLPAALVASYERAPNNNGAINGGN